VRNASQTCSADRARIGERQRAGIAAGGDQRGQPDHPGEARKLSSEFRADHIAQSGQHEYTVAHDQRTDQHEQIGADQRREQMIVGRGHQWVPLLPAQQDREGHATREHTQQNPSELDNPGIDEKGVELEHGCSLRIGGTRQAGRRTRTARKTACVREVNI
jgi:hypothetical protein